MMRNIRFTIAAGETKRFEVAGRYLELIDSNDPVSVYLDDASGGQTDRAIAILSGTYMTAAFGAFAIYSATAQTLELFVSDANGGTRRQPGNVRVIDQSRDKTIAGRQYIASVNQLASAGLNAYVGMYNNGGRMAIKRLMVQSATAGPAWVAKANGTGTALVAPVNDIPNKLITGALATARRASGYGAAALPTAGEVPGYVEFGRIYVPANTPVEYPLTTPLVFDSNSAIVVNGGALNRDISAIFDFEEY